MLTSDELDAMRRLTFMEPNDMQPVITMAIQSITLWERVRELEAELTAARELCREASIALQKHHSADWILSMAEGTGPLGKDCTICTASLFERLDGAATALASARSPRQAAAERLAAPLLALGPNAFSRMADQVGLALCYQDGPCRVTNTLWTVGEIRAAAQPPERRVPRAKGYPDDVQDLYEDKPPERGKCRRCKGQGWISRGKRGTPDRCPDCGGSGKEST